MKWQPIETAPKDGTRVLLWTETRGSGDHDYVEVACEGNHFAVAQIGFWETEINAPMLTSPAHWEKGLIGDPTHWQPIPNGPEAAE